MLELTSNPARVPAEVIKVLLKSVAAEWDLERAALRSVDKALDTLHLEGARQGRGVGGRKSFSGGLASWQAKAVLRHVDNNLHRRIALDELAELSQLSRTQFRRSFTKSFGMPPHRWIIHRRISLAQDIMAGGKEKLSEVALRCGLFDQSHFTRVFVNTTAITPSAWRRNRGLHGDKGVIDLPFAWRMTPCEEASFVAYLDRTPPTVLIVYPSERPTCASLASGREKS